MTYFYHYPESPRVLAIIRYPRDPDMNLFNVRPFQLLAVMKHWRTTLEADYINDFTNRSASSSPSQDLNWRGDLADLVYLFACKLLVPLVWFCHSTLLFYYFPLQIIAVKSTIVVAPSMRSCHIEAEGTRSTMHNVHFVKYYGPVVKSWNPKIHFLMGKKYFWCYFSYVVLGRKL